MFYKLFGLIFIILFFQAYYAACPSGWVGRRNSNFCYLFTIKKPPISWLESKLYCTSNGGDLLWIATTEEQIWLFHQIHQFLIVEGEHKWWFGLNSRDDNTTLVWDRSEEFNNTILDDIWLPGQPTSNGTHCGLIWSVVITMTSCDDLNQVICKSLKNTTGHQTTFPVQPGPATVLYSDKCGPLWNWVPSINSCYQFSDEALTWFQARDVCRNHGGYLASIITQTEQSYISHHIKTYTSKYLWLGLSAMRTGGVWEWVDHTPLGFAKWKTGQPNSISHDEDCGGICLDKGSWGVFPCQNQTGFICKKPGEVTTTTFITTSTYSTLPVPQSSDLSYHAIVGVICLVIVVGLIFFAFILYTCRIFRQGSTYVSSSGFENPMYHGDYDDDKSLKVFTLSSDKRINVSVSQETHEGSLSVNSISVTVETRTVNIRETEMVMLAAGDTCGTEINSVSDQTETSRKIQDEVLAESESRITDENSHVASVDVTGHVVATTNQHAEATDSPGVVNRVTSPVSTDASASDSVDIEEITPGQILGINKQLLQTYASDISPTPETNTSFIPSEDLVEDINTTPPNDEVGKY